MKSKIISISNGVAQVKYAPNTECALAEVTKYQKVGDIISERELVFNGGDKRFDELWAKYIREIKEG